MSDDDSDEGEGDNNEEVMKEHNNWVEATKKQNADRGALGYDVDEGDAGEDGDYEEDGEGEGDNEDESDEQENQAGSGNKRPRPDQNPYGRPQRQKR
mmetsp:Transcript_50678/g.101926  ORF Transcript_50678/g.101926 Transcript_50678/m.101926 type:complete len:97 (-) Transcript_50678:111-401(-)